MFIYSTRFIFTNYFFVFWIIFCRIERGSTAVRPDIPLLWWGNDGIKDLNFVREDEILHAMTNWQIA